MYPQGCGGSSPFFGTSLSSKTNKTNLFIGLRVADSSELGAVGLIGGQKRVSLSLSSNCSWVRGLGALTVHFSEPQFPSKISGFR